MHSFKYHCPDSIEEAVAALQSAKIPQLLAGGQTLLPLLKLRRLNPSDILKVSAILPREIEAGAASVTIGAGATHAEVARSDVLKERIPALASLAGEIGDPATRHRGTLGGSLAVNDPVFDYSAACLALEASVRTTRRETQVSEFFRGAYATVLERDEIITSVTFQTPRRAAYLKTLDPAARSAIVGVFVALTEQGPRVAVTGAHAAGAFRHVGLEAALRGSFSPGALDAVEVSSEGFRSTLQGDPKYRANLVSVLAKRAVAMALGQA